MTLANLQTEWARLLLTTWVQAGVRDVVLSPGSRSTPFVHACTQLKGLRCHSIIDERSAAFFALGQARVTARPTLLVCTSGSAGGHYLPAVIEARYARLPLLVLTVDRPPELQDCGAPQTIDQRHLYGVHVNAFHELGMAEAEPAALSGLRSRAALAVRQCLSPTPGAVHVNAPARTPLEPVAPANPAERALQQRVTDLCAEPLPGEVPAQATADQDALRALAQRCRELPRGLIVAGPAGLNQGALQGDVRALSEATGYPVLSDLASQWGGARPGHAVLDGLFAGAAGSQSLRPQMVLQLGSPPTSSQFSKLLSSSQDIERYVLASFRNADPWNCATAHLRGSLAVTLPSLVAELAQLGPLPGGPGRGLGRPVTAAVEQLRSVQGALLEEPTGSASEARAVRALLAGLPEDALLMLGNSLAIRLADLWGADLPAGVGVLSQRGASGIDGLLSGAVGSALSSARPTALLLGDISLLHDLSALGLPAIAELESPLLVVVLNNDGGRIFDHLPMARVAGLEPEQRALWTTPHGRSFEHAARMFDVPWVSIEAGGDCLGALSAAWARPGLSLVEVTVPCDASVRLAEQLRTRFEAKFEAATEQGFAASEPASGAEGHARHD
jgi:2-succinyl-5-enolpyruvyl-6-hydroxy-3-cyclohexene-1-carboxylate synthase